MIGAVAVAVALDRRVRPVTGSSAVTVGLAVLIAAVPLLAAAGVFLLWSMARFHRGTLRSRAARESETAALEAGEMIALGLAGGLSVGAAHRVALDHAPPAVAEDLGRLVESIDRLGVVAALSADTGPLAPISTALVTATASGAPVLPALEAHIAQEHHRRHMESVERARRLPIRLLLPLTLLVLPGFVLITVGPAVIDSLARLGQ